MYTLELELLELREKKLTGSAKLGDIAVPKAEDAQRGGKADSGSLCFGVPALYMRHSRPSRALDRNHWPNMVPSFHSPGRLRWTDFGSQAPVNDLKWRTSRPSTMLNRKSSNLV